MIQIYKKSPIFTPPCTVTVSMRLSGTRVAGKPLDGELAQLVPPGPRKPNSAGADAGVLIADTYFKSKKAHPLFQRSQMHIIALYPISKKGQKSTMCPSMHPRAFQCFFVFPIPLSFRAEPKAPSRNLYFVCIFRKKITDI